MCMAPPESVRAREKITAQQESVDRRLLPRAVFVKAISIKNTEAKDENGYKKPFCFN